MTKKAQNDQRIATNKIGQFKTKPDDLGRTELKPLDSRIYSGLAGAGHRLGGRQRVFS
ncbi:hypothetical protein ABU614_08545 [Lysobacter firmicutimachus]|uniref:Uncharacterized protein n=1 Tax=Lysobacter firmicutimachus TaxID=1792846 RepID=A0AAU8N161_9GAMM